MSRSSLEKFIHRMTRPWLYCRSSKERGGDRETRRNGDKIPIFRLPLSPSPCLLVSPSTYRSSAEFFFQPGDLFVVVVADGAAGLTHHRADFFEGMAQSQQV